MSLLSPPLTPTVDEEMLESGTAWKPALSKLEKWKPTITRIANMRVAQHCRDALRPIWPTFHFRTARNKKLHSTAWLDGLRGFGALLVYWLHHQLYAHEALNSHSSFQSAFGFNRQHLFVCLPGIRTFFTGGHLAVSVFFVISGYVLANKPLRLIQSGEYVQLGDNLASSLFRRWLRLFLPVIVTTFMFMTWWRAFNVVVRPPQPQPTYRLEVRNWYNEFANFSFPFRLGGDIFFSYNFHVWSIPIEFRGSLIVYTTLMALSRCKRNARLLCEAGLIVYFLYIADGFFGAMFIAGMLLSDLDNLAATNNLPHLFSSLARYKTILFTALFTLGIILGGVPSANNDLNELRDSPGWALLSRLKPTAMFDYKWFYLFWASSFIVASIPRLPWLKAFFEHDVNQYLGRISYAFYLVHGPIILVLGSRVYAAAGWPRVDQAVVVPQAWIRAFPLPKWGPAGLEVSFLVPQLVLLPVTLWVAEVATKLVDEPSIRVTQWLYRLVVAPAGVNEKL